MRNTIHSIHEALTEAQWELLTAKSERLEDREAFLLVFAPDSDEVKRAAIVKADPLRGALRSQGKTIADVAATCGGETVVVANEFFFETVLFFACIEILLGSDRCESDESGNSKGQHISN